MVTNKFDNVKLEAFVKIMSGISAIIGGIIFSGFCSWILIKNMHSITKVAVIPFIVCGLAVLIIGIVLLLQGLNMKKALKDMKNGNYSEVNNIEKKHNTLNKANLLASKLYLIGFSVFWFGFLIIMDFFAIRDWSNNGWQMFIFSLIFWAAGIVMIRSKWKKK